MQRMQLHYAGQMQVCMQRRMQMVCRAHAVVAHIQIVCRIHYAEVMQSRCRGYAVYADTRLVFGMDVCSVCSRGSGSEVGIEPTTHECEVSASTTRLPKAISHKVGIAFGDSQWASAPNSLSQ